MSVSISPKESSLFKKLQKGINVSMSLPLQWPDLTADHVSFLFSTHLRALLVTFIGTGLGWTLGLVSTCG